MSSEEQDNAQQKSDQMQGDDQVYEIGDSPEMYHPKRCCKVRNAENDGIDVVSTTNPTADELCHVCALFV